jgi:hypothetical protein
MTRNVSACPEDNRLCLWMNAQNVARCFRHRDIAASADFAVARITLRSLGVGGYVMEVPRALPVGLHDAAHSERKERS